VHRVSAISEDYPGSLLDLRHRVPAGIPEPERALSLAVAAGFPAVDDGRLRIGLDPPHREGGRYVVVHPGASVPSRAIPAALAEQIVAALRAAGHRVVVTVGPERTTLPELAALLAGADCVVVGNTGPAHLAAAVGTPVVSLYAPTVPFGQWGPYRVPHVRLDPSEVDADDIPPAVELLV